MNAADVDVGGCRFRRNLRSLHIHFDGLVIVPDSGVSIPGINHHQADLFFGGYRIISFGDGVLGHLNSLFVGEDRFLVARLVGLHCTQVLIELPAVWIGCDQLLQDISGRGPILSAERLVELHD